MCWTLFHFYRAIKVFLTFFCLLMEGFGPWSEQKMADPRDPKTYPDSTAPVPQHCFYIVEFHMHWKKRLCVGWRYFYLAVGWIHEYDVLHEGGRGCRHPSEGGREGAPPKHQNYRSPLNGFTINSGHLRARQTISYNFLQLCTLAVLYQK